MTTKRALTKARRGAAFLDGKLGTGWRRRIRRRKLDMADGGYERGECGCILAQLYGNYSSGTEAVGLGDSHCRQKVLGFDYSKGADYDQLTEAWLTVLREKT